MCFTILYKVVIMHKASHHILLLGKGLIHLWISWGIHLVVVFDSCNLSWEAGVIWFLMYLLFFIIAAFILKLSLVPFCGPNDWLRFKNYWLQSWRLHRDRSWRFLLDFLQFALLLLLHQSFHFGHFLSLFVLTRHLRSGFRSRLCLLLLLELLSLTLFFNQP